MTTPYFITDTAQNDLEEIWEYIAIDNPIAADEFIAVLLDLLEQIGVMPRMGRPREEIGDNVRSHPCKNYVIYYQPGESSRIKVLRIIHGARDTRDLSSN